MNKFINGVYCNREASWLKFNERVLEEAADLNNPLLERAKFLSIFSSNLDEFFMVRVGSLVNQDALTPAARENKTKLTAAEQIDGVLAETKRLYKLRNTVFEQLRADLKSENIKLIRGDKMNVKQRIEAQNYFVSNLLPYLSPVVLDAKHPLMRFENNRLYFFYELEKGGREMPGVLPVPERLMGLYRFKCSEKTVLITLPDIIRTFSELVFRSYNIKVSAAIRVTRNADFDATGGDVDSEYENDFAKYLKEKIDLRPSQQVVRAEIDSDLEKVKKFLTKNVGISAKQIFYIKHYFAYKFMFSLDSFLDPEQAARLKYKPFKPVYPKDLQGMPLLKYVEKKDIFLSYPYDSMEALIRLVNEAVDSGKLNSIRITIYRLADHSRIVEALLRAAEAGVEVTVVVELMARFDEENNLNYASVLQGAGCTVIYGVNSKKVHSKILTMVLSEGDQIKYVTHIGTGNYNEKTSRQYTDLNIITSDEKIGQDAAAFFRNIAIDVDTYPYERLLVAPTNLKKVLLSEIGVETEKAKAGLESCVTAKMNSLTDKDMIDALIAASEAGVRIRLIVRGICCLLPGVVGHTENIEVISIVGRFLEHSRIYCFGCGDDRRIYISSADLMTRNISRRVELAAPVLDRQIADKIYDMLQILLKDNVKARKLLPDGNYQRVASDETLLEAQSYFLKK